MVVPAPPPPSPLVKTPKECYKPSNLQFTSNPEPSEKSQFWLNWKSLGHFRVFYCDKYKEIIYQSQFPERMCECISHKLVFMRLLSPVRSHLNAGQLPVTCDGP